MSYDYQKERPGLFTDEGQRMLLSVRDRTQRMLAASGAARLQEMIKGETAEAFYSTAQRELAPRILHEVRYILAKL